MMSAVGMWVPACRDPSAVETGGKSRMGFRASPRWRDFSTVSTARHFHSAGLYPQDGPPAGHPLREGFIGLYPVISTPSVGHEKYSGGVSHSFRDPAGRDHDSAALTPPSCNPPVERGLDKAAAGTARERQPRPSGGPPPQWPCCAPCAPAAERRAGSHGVERNGNG